MALIDDIIAYYKLEDASDSVASFTLTNTGSVPFDPALIDNGGNFTPNDSLNNNSVLGSTGYPRSFSGWVKFDTLSTNDRAVFSLSDGTTDYYILKARDSDDHLVFRSNNATQAGDVDTGVVLSTATWYHWVVVQNSATSVTIYVNNTKTNTTASTFSATVSQFFLGYLGRSDVWYLDGLIDEVGIWNRALTDAEVTELYNSGAGFQYPFIPPEDLPTVDTLAATDVTHNSATLNGEILDVGVGDCSERGFVWGTTTQSDPGDVAPSSAGYDDYETESGTFSTGTFDYPLSALSPSTTYYVRAYAHNSDGYAYGDEVSFTTSATPPFRFTNIEGVTYDPDDTQTIFAERLNDMLERIEALEG